MYERQNRDIGLIQRDLCRIRDVADSFVRGIWIWQLVILDDSFDYLSARYARSVGDGFPLYPLLRPFPPFSGRTPNDGDTLTSMDYFSVRRIMRLPHWRFRVEVLRMNAHTYTLQAYTHYVVAITCFFCVSRSHAPRVYGLSDAFAMLMKVYN